MKKFIGFLFTGAVILSCNTPQKSSDSNTKLSAADKAAGWHLLFDGKTTKGWHKFGGGPAGSAWTVKEGCLVLDTSVKENWQIKNGGDIVSDESFSNFDLKYDWKIAQGGNSGVMFYVSEANKDNKWPWQTGPEMQVLDDVGHPDGKLYKHKAGDLYDLIACSQYTVKPWGQWNMAEIKCVNGKLDLYLNGVNVVSTTMWDDGWRKLVAGSKFANMPGFGTFKRGSIALQDHGNEVWFRNIMVRNL